MSDKPYDLITDDGERWTYSVDDDEDWRGYTDDYPDVPDFAAGFTLRKHHWAIQVPNGEGSAFDALVDQFQAVLLEKVDGKTEGAAGTVEYPARQMAQRLARLALIWADTRAAGGSETGGNR